MPNNIKLGVEGYADLSKIQKGLKDTAAELTKLNKQVATLASSLTKMSQGIGTVTSALNEQAKTIGTVTKANSSHFAGQAQVIKQQRVIASLYGKESVAASKRYLTGLHGLRHGLEQFNEEAKTAIVIQKDHISTLADTENAYQRFMLKGNMVSRTLDNVSKRIIGVGKNLQWTGRQMMVGLTLPIVAGGAMAIKTFLSMEKASLRAKKLSGVLGVDPRSKSKAMRDYKELEDAARKFAIKWGDSFESVIKIASEFKGAGFTADASKDLTDLSLAFDKLSGIGNLDASMKFIRVLAQTSGMKQQGDAVKYTADQLKYLSKVDESLTIDMNEIIATWPEVANTFKLAGIDIDKGIGMLSSAKQHGIDVAEAATAMTRGIARLTGGASTGKGRGLKLLKDQIDAWNASHPDQIISFFDKLGNLDKGNAGIERTAVAFHKMTQEEKLNFARLAFGTQQYQRLVPVLDSVATSMDKHGSKDNDYRKAIEVYQDFIAHKGKFSKDFSEAMKAYQEDPATKFAGLKEQLRQVAYTFGQELIPTVSKWAAQLGKVFNWFIHLSAGTKKFIKDFLVLAAVIGPITYGMGQMILLLTQISRFTLINPIKAFFHLFEMPGRFRNFTKSMAGDLIRLQEEFAKDQDIGKFINGIQNLRNEQKMLREATDRTTGAMSRQSAIARLFGARTSSKAAVASVVPGVNTHQVAGLEARAARYGHIASTTDMEARLAEENLYAFTPEKVPARTRIVRSQQRKIAAVSLPMPMRAIASARKRGADAKVMENLWNQYAPMLVANNALTMKELEDEVFMGKLLKKMEKEVGPTATPEAIQRFMQKHLSEKFPKLSTTSLATESVSGIINAQKGSGRLPLLPGYMTTAFAEHHAQAGTLNYEPEIVKRNKEIADKMQREVAEFKATGKKPPKGSAARRYIRVTEFRQELVNKIDEKVAKINQDVLDGKLDVAKANERRADLLKSRAAIIRRAKGADPLEAAIKKDMRDKLKGAYKTQIKQQAPTATEIRRDVVSRLGGFGFGETRKGTKITKNAALAKVIREQGLHMVIGKKGALPEEFWEYVGRQIHGGLTPRETVNELRTRFGSTKVGDQAHKDAIAVAGAIRQASQEYFAKLMPGLKLEDLEQQIMPKKEVLSDNPHQMKLNKGGKHAVGDSEEEKVFAMAAAEAADKEKQLEYVRQQSAELAARQNAAQREEQRIIDEHEAKIDKVADEKVGKLRAAEDKKVAKVNERNAKKLAALKAERDELRSKQAIAAKEEAELRAQIDAIYAGVEAEKQRVQNAVTTSLRGRSTKERAKFWLTGGLMGNAHGNISDEEMMARANLAQRGETITKSAVKKEMGKTGRISRIRTALKPSHKGTIKSALSHVGSGVKGGASGGYGLLAALQPGSLIKGAGEGIEKFAGKMGKLEGVMGKGTKAFGSMLPMVDMFTGGMGSAAAMGVEPVITSLGALGPLLIPIGLIAGAALLIWKNWKSVSKGLGSGLKDLKQGFTAVKDAIIGPFLSVFKRLNGQGGQMKDTWKSVGKILNVAFHAMGIGLKIVAAILKPIMTTLAELLYIAMKLGQFLVAVFTGQWKTAFTAIRGIVASAGKIILVAILSPINLILKAIKKLANISIFGHHIVPKGVRDEVNKASDFISGLPEKFRKAIDPAKEAGKATGKAFNKGAHDGAKTPKLPVPAPDPGQAKEAGDNAAKQFIDAYKNRLKELVDGWKQAALDAFDAAAKIQTDAIDAQIKKIDDLEKKLEEQQREAEYLQRRKELLAKRDAAMLQYSMDHSAAVYEGRFDDARKLTLDHQKDLSDIDKDIADNEKSHQDDLAQQARDAQKQQLQDQKDNLQKQLDIQKDLLQKQLDAITEYIPKNAAEAKKMQEAILAEMGKYGVKYSDMGASSAEAWGRGLAWAMDKARKDVAEDNAWQQMGDFIAGQVAAGMGIPKEEVKGGNAPKNTAQNAANAFGGTAWIATGTQNSAQNAANAFGGTDWINKYHTGGPVGFGPAKDVAATLQTGEFVVKRAAVSKYGLGALTALNEGNANVFHDGGIVGLPDTMSRKAIWNTTGKFLGGAANFGALTMDRLKTIYALRFFANHPEVVAALSGMSGVSAPSSPAGLTGPQGLLIKPLADFIVKMFPGSSIMSMLRPGAVTAHTGKPSLHSFGRAVDIGGTTAIMKKVFDYMLSNTGRFNLQELIFQHSIWNQGRGLHNWPWDDHMNHVHIGIRDAIAAGNLTQLMKGGQILSDGVAKLHRGESVLTKPLTDQMKANVGGGGNTYIVVDTFIGQEQWFKKMMEDHNIKVVSKKDREFGREVRKISSYADTKKGYR